MGTHPIFESDFDSNRMAATRRLNKELGDLKKSDEPFLKCVQDLQPNAQTQFKWSATILPEKLLSNYRNPTTHCELMSLKSI